MRHKTIPKFRSDREAAAFWERHASTSYLSDLEEVTVRIRPALRKQIAARAIARKGQGLRLPTNRAQLATSWSGWRRQSSPR